MPLQCAEPAETLLQHHFTTVYFLPSTCAVSPLCPYGRKGQDVREVEVKLCHLWLVPVDPSEWQNSQAGIYLSVLAAWQVQLLSV